MGGASGLTRAVLRVHRDEPQPVLSHLCITQLGCLVNRGGAEVEKESSWPSLGHTPIPLAEQPACQPHYVCAPCRRGIPERRLGCSKSVRKKVARYPPHTANILQRIKTHVGREKRNVSTWRIVLISKVL